MNHSSEFDWEPTPGLPGPLPPGENIIWQGSPDWLALAIDAFHARKVALYFLALVLLDVYTLTTQGTDVDALLAGPGLTLILSVAALSILLGLAWLTATATIYTLTNKRILIRFGIAIQLTLNLPFKQITAAQLHTTGNGIGDIPLQLTSSKRVSYLVLWPHVRRWTFTRPQPMLRRIAHAQSIAELIADAIAAERGNEVELAATLVSPKSHKVAGAVQNHASTGSVSRESISKPGVSSVYSQHECVELSS